MHSARLSDSDSESIRIRVHQSIQPLTHLPIIDIDKNRDYSIYSTEAISIVLLCEDERTLELNHCARIELSPTYQCSLCSVIVRVCVVLKRTVVGE